MKKFLIITCVVVLLGLIAIPVLGFGRSGIGGLMGGYIFNLDDDDLEQWLKDQVEDGWMTQKQADYILERHKLRDILDNKEEYFAYIDKQVAEGWLTEKQAEVLKERYELYKENMNKEGVNNGRFSGCFFRGKGMPFGGMRGRMGWRNR